MAAASEWVSDAAGDLGRLRASHGPAAPCALPGEGDGVWTGLKDVPPKIHIHAEPQKATLLEAGKSSAPFRKMRSTLDEGGP